jgi:hypothetical protein
MDNNYLPFDLETALKHPERVIYRDGSKPDEWHYFPTKGGLNLCAIFNGGAYWYFSDGLKAGEESVNNDLFLLPETKTVWINLYEMPLTTGGNAFWHPTKEEAEKHRSPGRFACIEHTIIINNTDVK